MFTRWELPPRFSCLARGRPVLDAWDDEYDAHGFLEPSQFANVTIISANLGTTIMATGSPQTRLLIWIDPSQLASAAAADVSAHAHVSREPHVQHVAATHRAIKLFPGCLRANSVDCTGYC
jgi:hypothetical protein